MKKNMGNMDRGIRVVVALVIAGLYFANLITGTLAIVLLVVAAIFLLTSAIGFCPLYALFGMSTCPIEGGETEMKEGEEQAQTPEGQNPNN